MVEPDNKTGTDQNKLSEALRESEDKYRELVKYAPVGIYEVDFRQKRFVSVNDAMCILTGYSRDELLSMNPFDILDEEGKHLFHDRINRWLKGEKVPSNIEYKVLAKDGRVIHSLLNVRFTTDENGIPLGAYVIGTDISERKAAEEALKQSEARFHSVLDNCNDIIYRLDTRTNRYEYISPSCERVVGYKPEELIWLAKNEAYQMIHPDDVSALLAAIDKLPEKGFAQAEYRQKSKNGEYRWLSNQMSVTRNDQGHIVYRNGNIRDITEKKQTEEELRQARQKLEIALNSGNIGIWELDFNKNELVIDERIERMFGLKSGDFSKTIQDFRNLIDEEDICHVDNAFRKSRDLNMPFETIFRIRIKTGENKYINTKAHLYKDTDGKVTSVIGVCIDVTGMRMNIEKTLVNLTDELLRSNKELESFAYAASHDMQEPLRMISSFTQLLEARYGDKLDQDGREFIRFAVEGSKRMQDQINGLLAYSRIQRKAKEFTEVDMNHVMDSVKAMLNLQIRQKDITLVTGNLPRIIADESQMVQLMQNLVGNALKFSSSQSTIHISCISDIMNHVFSVKDHGIGIESQYFERIFQIFQRLVLREQYEGTGIGLAICRRIIERHKGKIWVESQPGKGSTFYFSIPV